MKEMRQKVIEECTLKESAAINQILGRKVSKLGHSVCHHSRVEALFGAIIFGST